MNKFISGNTVRTVAMTVATISIIVVLGFIAVQTYVRWNLNQNFTFLGGFELEALTVSAFALLIALLFISRRE